MAALPTSPYSDSAAGDAAQRRVTTVRQMARLFEDASSWQRDHVRRQQLAVDVRQFSAAERRNFSVNSQLFFFPTTTTTTTSTSSTSTSSSVVAAAGSAASTMTTTVCDRRSKSKWHSSSADRRLDALGT